MKSFFANRSNTIIAILIGLFCALLTMGLYLRTPLFLEELDLKLSDVRFKYRENFEPERIQPNPNIVIVAIDEKSINEIGRWPWSRATIAKLVEKFYEYDVKLAAFDITFSEEESVKADKAFSDSLDVNENVVLGYFFRDDSTQETDKDALKIHNKSRINLVKFLKDFKNKPIREFDSVELNIPLIAENATGFGFFNIIPDNDGIYRKALLVVNYNDSYYPSLNLESSSVFMDKQILLTIADFGVSGIKLNELFVPVDENGRLLLNYYGKGGSFPVYSAVDVLNGNISKEKLENKLVFFGPTEIGIADIRATPFDPVSPGVEIQATAASNILDGNFLIKDGITQSIDLALIFFMTILLSLILIFTTRTLVSFLVLSLFLVVFFGTNFYFFSRLNYMLSILFPAFSISLTYVIYEAYRNITVERKSKFLRDAFTSYVSPEVVGQLIKNPDKLQLGGDRRKVTLLFSDIRGFTALSENTEPEKLVTLLNEYLTPMTEIVMSNFGTLDKFIGDAVMAIYGAPVEQEEQSLHACTSAIEMILKLNSINEQWTENGLPNIEIGIGINTGEAVVGNMGADIRFDYTAIGDTVNLAARLEGQTKYYGTNIIISENTKNELENCISNKPGGSFIIRELDLIRVKGKKKPIAIYQLIVPGTALVNNNLIDNYNEALKCYRNRDFKKALGLLKTILENVPGDTPSKLYIERCNYYLESPPPLEWDYVYTAESK